MAEPPSSWEMQEDENSSLSSTTFKLGGLNVNAVEFVPNFGFSSAPKPVPVAPQQPAVPKTPPSTPVVVPRTTTEDVNKQTEPVIKPAEITAQLQQSVTTNTTTTDIEFNEFADDETAGKCSTPGGAAISKEKKNIVVKRDIIRKKEPLNIIFCGHVDAGKSTIGGQLM